MKKTLIFVLLVLIIFSCDQSKKDKKYKYVEIVLSESLFGKSERSEKDTVIIQAKTDSIAYLEAFKKFSISEKATQEMKEVLGSTSTTPTDFKLINEQRENIALLISFDRIDSLKNDIRTGIFNLKNSFKEVMDDSKEEEIANFKKSVKVDSLKIKELDEFFNIKTDEFDPNDLVWYKPKSAPKYTNRNGIYCYFQSNNGMPSNLRMRLQYHADDWLFIQKVQFSIDGKAFEFIPRNTETDSGNGGRIWEWFDEDMGKSNTELLNALANAKSAKMKLIGSQYSKVKSITANQIRDIKRSLDFYKAMGGTY